MVIDGRTHFIRSHSPPQAALNPTISYRGETGLNSKATITGGAGFIGSHLCEAMRDCHEDISLLDNFSSGTKKNLRDALGTKNSIKVITGDCKNPLDVKKAIAEADIIYDANRAQRLYVEIPEGLRESRCSP